MLTGEEPAVGDRDAMGVATEIRENLLWAAERALGIDDPLGLAQGVQMPAECGRLGEGCEVAVARQSG
jgi:hypothetical protein